MQLKTNNWGLQAPGSRGYLWLLQLSIMYENMTFFQKKAGVRERMGSEVTPSPREDMQMSYIFAGGLLTWADPVFQKVRAKVSAFQCV